jgi:peptide/nickel transport system substrate-binding protein
VTGLIDVHRTAPDQARQLLDAAGWRPGPDGIRSKDGRRLAFKLGTYAGRAELEQFAVAILDMAKAAGIDVSIEKLQDVEQALAANAFDATMYSIGSAAFGDVSRLLATLYTPSPRNKDRYSNERVNAAFAQYVQSSDASQQARLFADMQRMIGEDVPIIPLVNPFQVVAYSKKVRDFKVHPLDSYKYTELMRLDA